MGDLAGKTVGDYVTLQRGTTYRGDLVGKPGPALLGLGSIEPGGGFRANHWRTFGGECPEKLTLVPGDLYVALKGATKDGSMIGSVARVPSMIAAGRLTQDTVKLGFREPDPDFAKYLYWLLRTPQYRDYCAGRAIGTTAVALNRADFLAYSVPPMTTESQHLVALFEAIDEKIELNRRMNQTLESIARAIFKSWFIDFDPVRSKMEGKMRGELGPSSEPWPPVPFSEAVEILSGGTPSTTEASYWGGSIPWYSVADAPSPGDVFVTQTEKTVTSEGIDNSAAQVVPELTTIISARGTVGRCALTGRDMAFNQSCFGLRPADHVGYYFTYFSTLRIVGELQQSAHGSVFSTITRPTFASVHVPQPPEDLVAAFEARVRPLMMRIWSNVGEARTLQMTRDSLLPRLIGGELTEGLA